MDAIVKSGEQDRSELQDQRSGQNQKDALERVTLELILLSMGILAGAMIWTWRIGLEANNLDHRLFHTTENLKGIKSNVEKMESRLK